jgi:hypothetical protein
MKGKIKPTQTPYPLIKKAQKTFMEPPPQANPIGTLSPTNLESHNFLVKTLLPPFTPPLTLKKNKNKKTPHPYAQII